MVIIKNKAKNVSCQKVRRMALKKRLITIADPMAKTGIISSEKYGVMAASIDKTINQIKIR